MRWQPLTIAETGDRITVTAVDIGVGRPMVVFAFLLLFLGTAAIVVNALWGKAYDRWEFDFERNPIVFAAAFFLVLGVAFFLAATHLFLRPRTYTVDRTTRELRWGTHAVPLDEVMRVHAKQLPARGVLTDYWQLTLTRRSGGPKAMGPATENAWLWNSVALALTAAVDAARTGKPFVEPSDLRLTKGRPTLMAILAWAAILLVIADVLFFVGLWFGRDRWLPQSQSPPAPTITP